MTYLFMDGQSHYRTASIAEKWNGGGPGWQVVPGGGRDGRNALRGDGTNNEISGSIVEYPRARVPHTSLTEGFSFCLERLPSDGWVFTWFEGVDAYIELRVKTGGYLEVFMLGTGYNFTVRSRCAVLRFNEYQVLEFHAASEAAPNSGEFRAKIDGREVSWASANTGLDTASTPADYDIFAVNGAGSTYHDGYRISDYYLSDGPFAGDCVVETIIPDGDGTYQDFELGAENSITHWESVTKPYLADTSSEPFVVGFDTGGIDSYTFTDLDSAWATEDTPILSVQVCPRVANPRFNHEHQAGYTAAICDYNGVDNDDDIYISGAYTSGTGEIAASLIRYAGTDSFSDFIAVGAAPNTRPGLLKSLYCFDANPSNGDADWTYSQVNACQFGVKAASVATTTGTHNHDLGTPFIQHFTDTTSSEVSRVIVNINHIVCTGVPGTTFAFFDDTFYQRIAILQMAVEVLIRRPVSTPAAFRCPSVDYPRLIGQ